MTAVDRLQRQGIANDRSPNVDAITGGHVDERVLEQRAEDEHETDDHPDVDGLDVGHARQGLVDAGALRGRRQDAEQADGHACRRRLHVDPERHPRQDNDQDRRDEHLDEEEADLSAQDETNLLARKRSYHTRRNVQSEMPTTLQRQANL